MKKEYFVIISEMALYLGMFITGGIACGIVATRGQIPKPFIIGFFSIALILAVFIHKWEMKTGTDFFLGLDFVCVVCTLFLFSFFECRDIYASKNTPETSASYEITINEKTFKISDFKTKVDGSIEFTADDGTIIHASTYELRKINQESEKISTSSEEEIMTKGEN